MQQLDLKLSVFLYIEHLRLQATSKNYYYRWNYICLVSCIHAYYDLHDAYIYGNYGNMYLSFLLPHAIFLVKQERFQNRTAIEIQMEPEKNSVTWEMVILYN